jgi:hypothetical protein
METREILKYEHLHMEYGVPQGGILSLLIFIIYGADLEEWKTTQAC